MNDALLLYPDWEARGHSPPLGTPTWFVEGLKVSSPHQRYEKAWCRRLAQKRKRQSAASVETGIELCTAVKGGAFAAAKFDRACVS